MGFFNWLFKAFLEVLWGKAIYEGKGLAEIGKDNATSKKNSDKLKVIINKPGATDAEIEEAMLDHSNGRN